MLNSNQVYNININIYCILYDTIDINIENADGNKILLIQVFSHSFSIDVIKNA
jgi:hypothetical protein